MNLRAQVGPRPKKSAGSLANGTVVWIEQAGRHARVHSYIKLSVST